MSAGNLQPTIYFPAGDHPKGDNLQPRFGFTLVEVMLAVALVAVIAVAGFDLLWQVIAAQSKSLAVHEVQSNAALALRRMEAEIRGARTVRRGSGVSDFSVHPGRLTLDYPGDGTDVVFDTATSTIAYGGSTVQIRKLRVAVGAGVPVALTSDRVDVVNLVFSDLTRGVLDTVRIDLTLRAVNPGGTKDRDAEFSAATSVSRRP